MLVDSCRAPHGACGLKQDESGECRHGDACPSLAIAFDAEGNPTKVGAGFAHGQGIESSALI